MFIDTCTLYWYWEIVVDKKVWRVKWWWINENSLYAISMKPKLFIRIAKFLDETKLI